MVPFLIYSKIGEPILHAAYDMYLVPFYQKVTSNVPFSAPVLKVLLYSGSIFINISTSIVKFCSGTPKAEEIEGDRKRRIGKEE